MKFIIPLFALAFLLVSCSRFSPKPTVVSPPTGQETTGGGPGAPAAPLNFKWDGKLLSGVHTVLLRTSKGDVTLELNADAAPKTVTNFVTLATNGYYNGQMFHRIIENFMVQGGDPNGNGTGGVSVYGDTFEDEVNANSYGLQGKVIKNLAKGQEVPADIANLTIKQYYEKLGYRYNDQLRSLPMKRGAIVMANRGPNTNGSQFFIITAEKTPWLEAKHTVFGNVSKGMDVIDTISKLPRDASDKPTEPVTYTVEVKS
ncbi:MAG: peptidyl-prolyl isomerase [Candidatus Peregrinibacteria bacterium Greene0416_19]|nr:MAG: peptidyl-prolyl isomerase [Candidatus Peregrinibacteria bacterium Greene0416_19]